MQSITLCRCAGIFGVSIVVSLGTACFLVEGIDPHDDGVPDGGRDSGSIGDATADSGSISDAKAEAGVDTASKGTWSTVVLPSNGGISGNFCTSGCTSLTMTVPSTGSGHLLYVGVVGVNGGTIHSMPTGWTLDSGCAGAGMSCAYILSSASGVTSIPITFSASDSYGISYYELSPGSGTASKDTSGNVDIHTASTTQNGVTLTLTGTTDAILREWRSSQSISSVASPYTLDFSAVLGADNDIGATRYINTSSGAPDAVTFSSSATASEGAIAFTAM